jgi:hypothetical protein
MYGGQEEGEGGGGRGITSGCKLFMRFEIVHSPSLSLRVVEISGTFSD